MTTLKIAYSADTAIVATNWDDVASSDWATLPVVDNTSTLYVDVLVGGRSIGIRRQQFSPPMLLKSTFLITMIRMYQRQARVVLIRPSAQMMQLLLQTLSLMNSI